MISFSLNKTKKVRTALFSGDVDDAEVLQAYQDLLAEPDYDPTVDDLVDMRDVTSLRVSQATLRQIIALYTPVDALAVPTRLAIVAGSDLTFGMSRMYELLRGDDVPEDICVFRSYDQAIDWLARP